MTDIKVEDILPALEQIEKLHKVSRNEIIKFIELAVTSAANKFFGSEYKIITEIKPENFNIQTFIIKKVVNNVTNDKQEISLEEAKKYNSDAKIGDEIKILVDNASFLRLAAQSAKKVVIQRLRESYKKNLLEEFESKIGEVISANVYAIRGKTIILEIVGGVEGIIPQREQVFKEKFKIGQTIKVLVKEVEKTKKGIRVIASRFDKNFIKKLFMSEIPEIKENVVEIVNIVRAAGNRTKIVLKSNNPKVDPVGSCVGVKGSRIKLIIDELQGEKIDLIPYTEDILKFIALCLSPWKVEKVEIEDPDKKIARVYLSKSLYDTVYGKSNINVNLAKELTNWDIKIYPLEDSKSKND
ncbi:MAG: transcription termination factor NusA [Elusimicrobiota bacterium]|nr:transcription termination factor NusA [Endomicrobiia bacterium]MDW8165179.1 transcription termination factor NusA [Elusimicrobiota bacterium]